MSKGRRSRLRYDLTKLINHVRDSDESFKTITYWVFEEGDDRAQGIVAAALLEQSLEYALSGNFVLGAEDTHALFADQDDGGISTFASKIKLAFALGLIEKIIQTELVKIKNIRNVFAHTRATVNFSTAEISAACNDLKIPEIIAYGGVVGEKPTTAKGKYADAIKFIYLYFSGTETYENVKSPLTYEYSDYYCNVFLKKPSTSQMAKALLDADFSQRTSETSQEK